MRITKKRSFGVVKEEFLWERSTKSSNSWMPQERIQELCSRWALVCQDAHHYFQNSHRRNSLFLGVRAFSSSKHPTRYLCKPFCSCQPWPRSWMGRSTGWMLFAPCLMATAKSLWAASRLLAKYEPVLCWINSKDISKCCEPWLCHWRGCSTAPGRYRREARRQLAGICVKLLICKQGACCAFKSLSH